MIWPFPATLFKSKYGVSQIKKIFIFENYLLYKSKSPEFHIEPKKAFVFFYIDTLTAKFLAMCYDGC